MKPSTRIAAASLLIVLSISGCVTTSTKTSGPMVVRSIITALIQQHQFPISSESIAQYFPANERARLAKVVKTDAGQRIVDYEWRSADGDCFMYFMADQEIAEVHHAWAKCTIGTASDARDILVQWARAARPTVPYEQIPNETIPYTRFFLTMNGSVAVDLSLDGEATHNTIGIEFRSGVTAQPNE